MAIVTLVNYATSSGKEPFVEWLHSLDADVRFVVRARLARVRVGNFGDCKALKGCGGVSELRVNYGPGYRIYYGRYGFEIMVLLVGGDKASQRRDIELAKKYWRAYKGAIK